MTQGSNEPAQGADQMEKGLRRDYSIDLPLLNTRVVARSLLAQSQALLPVAHLMAKLLAVVKTKKNVNSYITLLKLRFFKCEY